MIYLITGASHTGKTALAQKLLERRHCPYLSLDHLKMGLIRSGNTSLTPYSSEEELTALLWPIVREMIKTAIENRQDLTVEGCYIPFDWEADFGPEYRAHIRYLCLVMTENYIRTRFSDIKAFANVVEQRLDDSDCTMESVLADNAWFLSQATASGVPCLLIDDGYDVENAL